jgi:hypothetical protein
MSRFMKPLDEIDPLEWNDGVAKKTFLDHRLEVMPLWQAWRTDVLLAKYKVEYGADLSLAKLSLLKRAVTMQVQCEYAEALYRVSGGIAGDDYTRNVKGLRQILIDLGLDMKASATSALAEHIRNKKTALTLVSSNVAPADETLWADEPQPGRD